MLGFLVAMDSRAQKASFFRKVLLRQMRLVEAEWLPLPKIKSSPSRVRCSSYIQQETVPRCAYLWLADPARLPAIREEELRSDTNSGSHVFIDHMCKDTLKRLDASEVGALRNCVVLVGNYRCWG